MKLRNLVIIFFAALIASSKVDASVTLTIENGLLVGAENVDIGGTKYNVKFVDGSCLNLFKECGNADAPYTIRFDTQQEALNAAQALMASVFVDGSSGQFDSQPSLTFGCSQTSRDCSTLVPYDNLTNGIPGVFAFNSPTETADRGNVGSNRPVGEDSSNLTFVNYAVFSGVAAIPEPSTWLMILAGFAVAGFAMKRRQKTLILV